MTKTGKHLYNLFLSLTLTIFFFMLILPVQAGNLCPCNDPDTCMEWVSDSSLSIKWGEVKTVEVDDVIYTFRADDFNQDLDAVSISIEKDGVTRKEFLFLDAGDDSWLDWDHEIKVELTGISVDSSKTPSAAVKIYRRGLPELDIEVDASSETIEGVEVSSEQYAPGEEKQIDITVKNTGDAWIENTVLEVYVGDLKVRDKGEFQLKGDFIKTSLDCLEVGDSVELNFTVVAPEWDGKTSPYNINYDINATATGYDIIDDSYEFNGSLRLECTDPDLEVTLEVVKEEVNMSTWYISEMKTSADTYSSVDQEVKDAQEYSFLRTRIYNTGLYTIDDLDVQFSEIPEDFVISEVYESGDYSSMEANGQYYIGQKLVPIKPGKYSFDKVVVTATFFGEDLKWESGSETLTVHGPHIVLEKTLSVLGDDYSVTLKISNDGDRAAWINLTDTIPEGVNYVAGSLEKSMETSETSLGEWDLSVSRINNVQIINLKNMVIQPGSSQVFGYEISSDDAPDLPPAISEFKSLWNDYEGEVQSSYYVGGKEITQSWEPLKGGWVSSQESLVDSVSNSVQSEKKDSDKSSINNKESDLHSVSDLSMESNGSSSEVANVSSLPPVLQPVGKVFGNVRNIFSGLLLFETGIASFVESNFFAVVIVIAFSSFVIVSFLVKGRI